MTGRPTSPYSAMAIVRRFSPRITAGQSVAKVNRDVRSRVQQAMTPMNIVRGLTVAGALACLVVTGCEHSGEPAPPQSSPPAASAGTDTPAVVDCGTERIGPGSVAAEDARRCFIEAVAAGQAATLESTVLDQEGDPTVYSLTSDTRGGVTVVEDRSESRFRGAGVPARVRFVCTSMDTSQGTGSGNADLVVHRLRGCTSPAPI